MPCVIRVPEEPIPGAWSAPDPRSGNHGDGRNLDSGRWVGTGMASGHKITVTPAQVHVEVTLGGEKLAETDRPVLLDETGLPTRYYLPRQDVRTDLLKPTDHATTCPFKGQASYWSAQVGGETYENLVWSYEEPIPQAEGITGLMSFYPDQVELTVNGQLAG
jgi:uncharacterized protein (DUF427 family)